MVQIVDKMGSGGRLGAAFGTGISSALQQLAQTKLQQIQQAHQRQQLTSGLESLGLSPQQAQAYSMLPESALGPLLKQHQRTQQLSQIPGLQALFNPNQDQLGQAQVTPGVVSQQQEPSFGSGGSMDQFAGSGIPQEAITAATVIDPTLGNALRAQEAQKETSAYNRAKIAQGEKKLAAEEDARNYEINKPYITSINQKARDAGNAIKNNEQIIKIIDADKWGSPKLRSLAGKVGFESLIENPTSQSVKALVNDQFLKTMEAIGARNLSDFESKQALASLPNLLQAPQAAKFIAKNKILEAKAIQLEKQIGDRILKENKGRTPRNFEALVQEEMEPHRIKLREEFDKNLESIIGSQSKDAQNLSEESFDELPKDAQIGDRYVNDNGKEVEWTGSGWKTVK